MISDLQEAKKGGLENYFPEVVKQMAIAFRLIIYIWWKLLQRTKLKVYQYLYLAYIFCNNLLLYFMQ